LKEGWSWCSRWCGGWSWCGAGVRVGLVTRVGVGCRDGGGADAGVGAKDEIGAVFGAEVWAGLVLELVLEYRQKLALPPHEPCLPAAGLCRG
jgi:hypothetical protein